MQAPAAAPASRWRRWRRDPYLWAFLIGAAIVTLSVPFFRRVPPAPAPIADMPAWRLLDASGRVVDSASLRGRTYLLVLVDGACQGSCARVGRDLARMEKALREIRADVLIVTVDVGAGAGAAAGWTAFLERSGGQAEGWLALGADPAAACALAQQAFARVRGLNVPCERVHDLADDPHALIVDQDGRIRASIRLDREGLDETFHRSLAVLEKRLIEVQEVPR